METSGAGRRSASEVLAATAPLEPEPSWQPERPTSSSTPSACLEIDFTKLPRPLLFCPVTDRKRRSITCADDPAMFEGIGSTGSAVRGQERGYSDGMAASLPPPL